MVNRISKHSVVTSTTARRICNSCHREGKKVVFTNGCFDIIHTGHLSYLKRAKSLGDILIVGVNSDKSTKVIKGERRPINSQAERAKIIASLHFVDYVVIFDEVTPSKIISYLKPDLHVKGGDYKARSLPETAVIESYGGKIRILPYQEGKSTSNIIKEVIRRYARND